LAKANASHLAAQFRPRARRADSALRVSRPMRASLDDAD
jgi:hypothetical protein